MKSLPHRKLNRLPSWNYSTPGWYYITICTKNRVPWFREIRNRYVCLSKIGQIAYQCWVDIPNHYANVSLDGFIIMPDHMHGILIINEEQFVRNKHVCSLPVWQTQWAGSLSSIIRGFKSSTTRIARKSDFYDFAWQKSYYDHIIRHEKDLRRIRKYIQENPLQCNELQNG